MQRNNARLSSPESRAFFILANNSVLCPLTVLTPLTFSLTPLTSSLTFSLPLPLAGNTFGTLFRVTTFGESHGAAIGCIVDGCPAGLLFDLDYIQHELDRRRPGQSSIVTQRKESDTVQVLSGVFEGRTTGTPIGLMIPNEDQRSRDYDHLAEAFRPSHADYTWQAKYGYRDHRGGGRSSARETAARVAAGAIAKLFLKTQGVDIQAYVSQVGHLATTSDYLQLDLTLTETNDIRCPDPALAEKMIQLIKKVRKAGDTIGGVVSAVIRGCPVGLGEPVFDKLHADLGKAMLSINAAKGFEYGSGFEGVKMLGSEHNDLFSPPLPPRRGGELDSGGAEDSTNLVDSFSPPLPPRRGGELDGGGAEDPTNLVDSFGPPLPPRRGGELDSGGAEYPTNLIEPDSGGAAGRGVIGSPPLRGGGGGATLTNHSGGIQGGISTGMDIYFRVAFKPVATIMRDQPSINAAGEAVTVKGKGRHDPCVVPRAVPIVEAMAALVLADALLRQRANKR